MNRRIYFTSICLLVLIPVIQSGCKKETASVPSVITLHVYSITTNSATSGGIISDDGGIEIIAKGLVIGLDSMLSWNQNIGVETSGAGKEKFSNTFTGLLPGSRYYIRAYASNVKGTGYGASIGFSTQIIPCPGMPSVSDIDGNVYSTVYIGKQCWLRENLKTTKYRDGTSIVFPGSSNAAWQSNTTGAYSWYANDISLKDEYGALYNWHAVVNPAGLCPEGWRVSGYDDWSALNVYIGGDPSKIANKLKTCQQIDSPLGGECATSDHPRWTRHDTHFGTDDHAFSALPGGGRFYDGSFFKLGDAGYWWNKDEHSSSSGWAIQMTHNFGGVGAYFFNKRHGHSVRCIKE